MQRRGITLNTLILFISVSSFCFGQHPVEVLAIKSQIKVLKNIEKQDYLDSLASAFQNTENSKQIKGQVYYQIAFQFKRIAQFEKAITNYFKAAAYGEDNPLLSGKAFWKVGNTYLAINRPDSAIHYLLLSATHLKSKQDTKHQKYLAYAYLDLCIAYQDQGDYEQAIQFAGNAVSKYRQLEDDFTAGFALSLQAGVYYDQQLYSKAIACYQQANISYKQLPVEDQQALCNHLFDVFANLGNCYLKKNKLDSALLHYQKVITSDCPYITEQKVIAKEHIGVIYRKQKAYSKSLATLENVLENRVQMSGKDHPDLASIYDNIGDVFLDQGKYTEAVTQYDKAIKQVLGKRDVHNSEAISNHVVDAHSVHLLTFLLSKATALRNLFERTKQQQQLQSALSTLEIADALIDRMRQEHTVEASKLFWRETTRPIYEQAIAISFLSGNQATAFYFIEKSKAVLLADALNVQQAGKNAGLPSETIQQIRKYQEDLHQQKTPDIQQQSELNRLIATLEQEYPAFYQFKYGKQVPSLEDVKSQLLNDTTALIQYFVGDSTIYSISVTARETQMLTKHYNTADLNRLEQLTAFTRNPRMYDLYPDTFKVVSQALFSLVWPVEFEGVNRYLIVPDAWLHSLNFELLMDERASFLIQKHTFHYHWSATIANYVRKGNKQAASQFLGMAPVSFNAGLNLSSLEHSAKELSTIGDLIAGKQLLENNASYDAVMKQLEENWRILHWSTHAKATVSNSYLALKDSLIDICQIYQWSLPQTELVTLSACETTLGIYHKGEGVSSLARAFIYAGAQCVVASLWEINDESTAGLMLDFYGNLKAGVPKDVALRQAKLNQMQQTQNPYHWAGLISIGNERPIGKITAAQNTGLSILTLIGLLVVGLGISFFKLQN